MNLKNLSIIKSIIILCYILICTNKLQLHIYRILIAIVIGTYLNLNHTSRFVNKNYNKTEKNAIDIYLTVSHGR